MTLKGDILEDPANEPQKDMYMMSVDPEDAPDKPEWVTLFHFAQHIPSSFDLRTQKLHFRFCPLQIHADMLKLG